MDRTVTRDLLVADKVDDAIARLVREIAKATEDESRRPKVEVLPTVEFRRPMGFD